MGGARRDEEKARAKERVYSHRDEFGQWDPKNQRPELWNIFNPRHRIGEHVVEDLVALAAAGAGDPQHAAGAAMSRSETMRVFTAAALAASRYASWSGHWRGLLRDRDQLARIYGAATS